MSFLRPNPTHGEHLAIVTQVQASVVSQVTFGASIFPHENPNPPPQPHVERQFHSAMLATTTSSSIDRARLSHVLWTLKMKKKKRATFVMRNRPRERPCACVPTPMSWHLALKMCVKSITHLWGEGIDRFCSESKFTKPDEYLNF